jgi:hypothetical protein
MAEIAPLLQTRESELFSFLFKRDAIRERNREFKRDIRER